MYQNEDDQLKDMKIKYHNIFPPDQLDHYIKAGIEQAEVKKQRRQRTTFSSVAVMAILVLFLMSIRVSPVFAAYIGQIPGLDRLVEMIQGDRGLRSAIENNYVQVIDQSDQHHGITFTVDEIILDESKMILFYTITSEQPYDHMILSDTIFTDEFGKEISGASSLSGHFNEEKKNQTAHGKIDIDFISGEDLPEEVTITTGIDITPTIKDAAKNLWAVTFTIDHEKFANQKESYPLNETVTIEDQEITFKEINIYPTKIAIHIEYNDQNTKELFAFDDLAIVNENGDEWASITNGVTGQIINENEHILFLQSNFFDHPEEMYLQFSSVRALDKDKTDVIVDLDKEHIIQKPDEQLELIKVSQGNKTTYLEFKLAKALPFDREILRQTFNQSYLDESGKEHELLNGFGIHFTEDESEQIEYLTVNNSKIITLKVTDYPTRINGDIKIKIK